MYFSCSSSVLQPPQKRCELSVTGFKVSCVLHLLWAQNVSFYFKQAAASSCFFFWVSSQSGPFMQIFPSQSDSDSNVCHKSKHLEAIWATQTSSLLCFQITDVRWLRCCALWCKLCSQVGIRKTPCQGRWNNSMAAAGAKGNYNIAARNADGGLNMR